MRIRTSDQFTLYRNTDPSSPDKFLFVANDDPGNERGFVQCEVFIPDQEAGEPTYQVVARKALYRWEVLRSTRRFIPVARPFVLRRFAGEEFAYG